MPNIRKMLVHTFYDFYGKIPMPVNFDHSNRSSKEEFQNKPGHTKEDATRKVIGVLSEKFLQSLQFLGTEPLHNFATAYKYASRDLSVHEDK